MKLIAIDTQYAQWIVSVIKRQSKMYWLLFAECSLLYGKKPSHFQSLLGADMICVLMQAHSTRSCRLQRESKAFALAYLQCSVFAEYLDVHRDFLSQSCGYSASKASIVVGALPLSSLVFAPLSGYLFDTPRKRHPAVAMLFIIGAVSGRFASWMHSDF